MSRGTALDVLIGTMLLLIFAGGVAAYALALGVSLYAINLGVTRFLPALHHHEMSAILAILVFLSLVSGVRQARKHCWRNAFLSLAIAPMILSILFANPGSAFGLNGSWWAVCIFVILGVPSGSPATRFRFFVIASAVCTIVAVNAGLLGAGLARIATDCVLVGCFAWLVKDARENWSGQKNPGPQAPLSITRA